MPLIVDVRGMFTPASIAKSLQELPPLKSPVMDAFFPEGSRQSHDFPVIGVEEFSERQLTIPVTRRGGRGAPVETERLSRNYIEPAPLKLTSALSGVELNNLKLLKPMSKQEWVSRKVDLFRRIIRRSTEHMSAMSLHGKISYPLRTETGWDVYEVDFGAPLSVSPPVKWDAADAKILDCRNTFREMKLALENEGWGVSIRIWAGHKAYDRLLHLADTATPSDKIGVRLSEAGLVVGGNFVVEEVGHSNKDPRTSALIPVVEPEEVMMFDSAARHSLFYCAVDDLESDLSGLPLFIGVEDRGGSLILRAESKPLPAPNVKAICWAKVVD